MHVLIIVLQLGRAIEGNEQASYDEILSVRDDLLCHLTLLCSKAWSLLQKAKKKLGKLDEDELLDNGSLVSEHLSNYLGSGTDKRKKRAKCVFERELNRRWSAHESARAQRVCRPLLVCDKKTALTYAKSDDVDTVVRSLCEQIRRHCALCLCF